MVNVSMQHGAAALPRTPCLLRVDARTGLSPLPRCPPLRQKSPATLVEKRGFSAYQSRSTWRWDRLPSDAAIADARSISCGRAFAPRLRGGNLTFAATACMDVCHRPSPAKRSLDAVWRESERGWTSPGTQVRRRGAPSSKSATLHRDHAGRAPRPFSTFSDTQFDEATFEGQLTGTRMSLTIVWHWILKLRARPSQRT